MPVGEKLTKLWARFWMRYAGLGFTGRIATRLAAWPAPPHKARQCLARMNPGGYISADAVVHHSALMLGSHIFVDDRAVLFQRKEGGPEKWKKGEQKENLASGL